MKILLLGVALLAYVSLVDGDLYMTNCRGSNNRLNEKSATRANGKRVFDSQNNARGGYNIGDRTDEKAESNYNKQYRMEYVMSPVDGTKGQSILPIEWTNQHGCGSNTDEDSNKLNCNIVVQMMCQEHQEHDRPQANKDELRDGTNTQTQRYRAPSNNEDSHEKFMVRFKNVDANKAYHEPLQWYDKCHKRKRNQGLFTADQKLGNKRRRRRRGTPKSAQHTRQNPQGQRRGFECPEERDYFPYWHPTPWKDLYVLAEREERCAYYREHSFNVAPKSECVEKWGKGPNDPPKHYSVHNNQIDCEASGGEWREFHNYLEILNTDTEPDCKAKNLTERFQGKLIWAYPMDHANKKCLVRLEAPECEVSPWSRVNHLGNGKNLEANRINWKIPAFPSNTSQKCVLRMRYNISTDDYNVETQDDGLTVVKNDTAPNGLRTKTMGRWGPLPKKNWIGRIDLGIGDETKFTPEESFTYNKTKDRKGPYQWIGFQSREFSEKYLKISFHIKFVDKVPPASGNFGMKVYGRINNTFVDKCVANEWCYVEYTTKCKRRGDGFHVILIFDSIEGKQVIKVAQFRVGILGIGKSPIYQNPTVSVGLDGIGLKLAINTAQFGRTFQDRCHVMILKPLDHIFTDNQTLHTVQVRGKRGNIVQTFPAVEYDFMPTDLEMKEKDFLYWTWTGSNTHDNQNPGGDGQTGDTGQGKDGTDRSNVCAVRNRDENYCLPTSDPAHLCNHITNVVHSADGMFTNVSLATARQDICIRLMSAGYYKCLWQREGCGKEYLLSKDPTQKNERKKMNDLLNNASPSFGGLLIIQLASGEYHYISTRNNAFTNRSQKATIKVVPDEPTEGETA